MQKYTLRFKEPFQDNYVKLRKFMTSNELSIGTKEYKLVLPMKFMSIVCEEWVIDTIRELDYIESITEQ